MKENLTLLIIDDDEDDRELFAASAGEIDEKIICLTAPAGLEALRILQNKENKLPDYIFLDINMPGLSGRKTLEEIKKDERLKNIPVIIYTVSQEVREANDLKSIGAAHFITKPVNPEEIYYLISAVINEEWYKI